MDHNTLEALAVLAWLGEKERCRRVYRHARLSACTLEEIPYWLGPLTDNMNTAVWPRMLSNATKQYNLLEKKANEHVLKSKT